MNAMTLGSGHVETVVSTEVEGRIGKSVTAKGQTRKEAQHSTPGNGGESFLISLLVQRKMRFADWR